MYSYILDDDVQDPNSIGSIKRSNNEIKVFLDSDEQQQDFVKTKELAEHLLLRLVTCVEVVQIESSINRVWPING